VARSLARELAEAGVTVVSGLAVGIDAVAHSGALEGGGRTIAVLGCGLDVRYPAANASLAQQIVDSGALLSEYPMGIGPEPWHFPARNRMVSGIALGTVVVEGARGSGAAITADFAMEQGREVFAVPGDVREPRTEVPHRLIQDGAKLVHKVADVLNELGLSAPMAKPSVEGAIPRPALSDAESRLLETLWLQPRQMDEVIVECGLPVTEVMSLLVILELKGLVRKLPANRYMRLHRSGAS
jgi:DNA processing protein